MGKEQPTSASRKKERLFLFLIAAVLLVLFVHLFMVLQGSFADVDKRLKDGTMVNLNAKDPARRLAEMLQKGFYFDDQRDIDLVEKTIAAGLNTGIKFDNIGELNKKRFNVNADDAFAEGGQSFKQRVTVSRATLGYTGDDSTRFDQERKSPPPFPAAADAGMDGPTISGTVLDKKQPVSGVLVRLQLILPQDSLFSDEEVDLTKKVVQKSPSFTKIFTKSCTCNRWWLLHGRTKTAAIPLKTFRKSAHLSCCHCSPATSLAKRRVPKALMMMPLLIFTARRTLSGCSQLKISILSERKNRSLSVRCMNLNMGTGPS